jgi:endonuclease V-like protein UPF0215 family
LDIDLEKASPGYRVASREQIFSAIEKPLKSDEPEIEISNYLGRARTYGYVEWNFVIRATTREHAYELLEKFVGRLNSPESLADIQRQGGGKFIFDVISDEASNADIDKHIDYAARQRTHFVMLDGVTQWRS